MEWMVQKQAMPIGIDLGTHRLKLAQLRQAKGELELVCAGAAEVALEAGMALDQRLKRVEPALAKALKMASFRGRQCVLSLPAQDVLVHHIKVACPEGVELASAVAAELHTKLPFSLDQAVVQHVAAGQVRSDGEPRQEVVVVACLRSTLDAYLAMTRRLRLDVQAINVEACAIVECFERLFRRASDADRTILFLDLGASSTQVVLSHGPRIVFARNLAVGGLQLDQAVAKGLKVSLKQAQAMRRDLQSNPKPTAAQDELYHMLDHPLDHLADEVTQCIRYYESVFRNQSVERAIFIGGQAYDKRLCQSLAQRLNLPAQIGDPLVQVARPSGTGIEIGLDRRNPQPDWAVAVGLSLGARGAA